MFPSSTFTPSQIADLIKLTQRPAPRTELLDLILPAPRWRNHQSAFVEVNLKTRSVGAVPLVNHGAAAYPSESFSESKMVYHPESIKQSANIPGNIVNDRLSEDPTFLNDERAQILADHRDNARLTREAMLALGLRGSYSYPVATQTGTVAVTTTIGTPANPTISKLLNAVGADYGTLEDVYQAFQSAIQSNSSDVYGHDSSSLVLLVGSDVWTVIAGLIQTFAAGITDYKSGLVNGEFILPDMRIKKVSGSFRTFSTAGVASSTPKIELLHAVMVDLNANHFGLYCALEDMKANNRAMEFFAKEWYQEDPSGLMIATEQKPFVFPDVRGIAISEVIS